MRRPDGGTQHLRSRPRKFAPSCGQETRNSGAVLGGRKFLDPSGRVRYNAIVKLERRRWLVILALGVIAFFLYRTVRHAWLERNQDKVILAVAGRYAVDPALVKAVIWRES